MEKTVLEQRFSQEVANQIVKDKQALLGICLDRYMKPNEELIKFIKNAVVKHGLLLAFVSNGRKESVYQVLRKVGIIEWADYIVTADILGSAKPSPEAYNYAMMMLGVAPREVIAFEDNEIGITAAKAAKITDIVEVSL